MNTADTFSLPNRLNGFALCGVGASEGQLHGMYYRVEYCGRSSAAAEYRYLTVTPGQAAPSEGNSWKPEREGTPVRFAKIPCGCGCRKPIDKCT